MDVSDFRRYLWTLENYADQLGNFQNLFFRSEFLLATVLTKKFLRAKWFQLIGSLL